MNRDARPGPRFGFPLLMGLGLIAGGTVLALENAGLDVPVPVTRLWPLLLVLVGLGNLLQRGVFRIGGHLLIYLGLFFQGLLLRPEPTLALAGPVGLLWLGVIITLRALRPAGPRNTPDSTLHDASPTCD